MRYWIRPARTQDYDVFKAFEELKTVDWTSHNKYAVGDIVYIYCALPLQRITHKCLVTDIDISYNNSIDDTKYAITRGGLSPSDYKSRFIRLKVLETFDNTVSLNDIGIKLLRSAITLTAEQSSIIDKLGK